ncbi:conserved hypothetical protein [Methanococcus vannielii SB]|uniref:Roadblock/LC7 family protein n=1 Tax=Methanococcus vannielii (strain ATCC 35089 / DSM 1224 / JCM 13029 / OCM 148 / SB) TaxID=406327 RepID=A6UP06_METVS|nr:hypothetical protein [Methanococcus vannielii]ABR54228.1 conserved hypothetical protein [Methanococcus vannielii SB]
MENLTLFTVSLGAGFLSSYYTLLKLKKDKKNLEVKEHAELELEVIAGLQKLKTRAISENPKKASDRYDLLEIALYHDILDITVVNEEGLPIVSTLMDPDDVSGQYSGIFQTINKVIGNVSKASVKSGDEYIYISTIEKNEMPFYIIANSNIEMSPMEEKELQSKVLGILDQYL